MRRFPLAAVAVIVAGSAAASEPGLTGLTGLLTVPSAEVTSEGTGSYGVSELNPKPDSQQAGTDYHATFGFLPGLELGGRLVDNPVLHNDLSANAKYSYGNLPGGASIAVGGQDIAGLAPHFRSAFAVATVPWELLNFSLGYGRGPDVLKGAFGGVQYQPFRFVQLLAEYDTKKVNEGLRLISDPVLGRMKIGATVQHRGATGNTEYGAYIAFPLGRQEPSLSKTVAPVDRAAPVTPAVAAIAQSAATAAETPAPGATSVSAVPETASPLAPRTPAPGTALREALTDLGFESVRVGVRSQRTLVVELENRRYNQSSADGVGLALGVIARKADPTIQDVELTLDAYGVPQETVTVGAAAYRAFLDNPSVADAEQVGLRARPADHVDDREVTWDGPAQSLRGAELVLEPVLRTFVGTEYGVLDYGLGVRARMTTALGHGLIANFGLQAPVALSENFHQGRNFGALAPRAGPDLAVLQYLFKLGPQWNWLMSAGRTEIFRAGMNVAALEQTWMSDEGSHLLRTKLMMLGDRSGYSKVALAGYTWFDPVWDYSIGITGGRFYAGDSGARLEFNRYFGDNICGVFYKVAGRYDQAAGIQVSFPITPRRDSYPGGLQIKGVRRWGTSLSSTLHTADGINHLRPLFLYEPQLDLDLRRDMLDSGRLGEGYLREELPRMREAYELWGR